MITAETIIALEGAVAEAKAQYEQLERSLDAFRRVYRAQSGAADSSRTAVMRQQGSTLKNELPAIGERRTLIADVRHQIKRFGQREFTVAQVEQLLLEERTSLPGSQPRARLAMILKKLEDSGEVERTYKGAGSEPNRFRLVQKNEGSAPITQDLF